MPCAVRPPQGLNMHYVRTQAIYATHCGDLSLAPKSWKFNNTNHPTHSECVCVFRYKLNNHPLRVVLYCHRFANYIRSLPANTQHQFTGLGAHMHLYYTYIFGCAVLGLFACTLCIGGAGEPLSGFWDIHCIAWRLRVVVRPHISKCVDVRKWLSAMYTYIQQTRSKF